MKISAILLAAGAGERLGKSEPKAFVKIKNREIFLSSLDLLGKQKEVSEIILVVPKAKISTTKQLTKNYKKIKKVVSGGSTRQKSLEAGLRFCSEKIVLSQNAANPFATAREIENLIKNIAKFDAVGVGRRPDSTVRLESKTLDRQKIWLMETPQIVKKEFLEKGLRIVNSKKIEATDELALVELVGGSVKVIPADQENFKITHPADLEKCSKFQVLSSMRIGLGHDSHKFSRTKKALFLGGLRISQTGGLEGNSDGDVILHALTNAISSALGGGSLSTFSDPLCQKGIKDSQKYLGIILQKMRSQNFAIANLAISVEGKKPKLEKHFPRIRKNLAKLLKFEPDKIGLTATTGEGLTSFGRGEGLQVFALILLEK